MAALGLAVLRLTVAAVLVAHGAHQLFGVFGGAEAGPGGLAATASYFSHLGLTPAMPLAILAGLIQLAGGVFIAIGWLTRWSALAVAGYAGILVWKDYVRWGFFINWALDPSRGNGIEYSVVLIGALACLFFAGGGDFSIDGRRARRAAARASGRARLRRN
jgi:putative oxidoreductase